jgi:hypothetical protein
VLIGQGILTGVGLGVALGLAVYLSGNSDYRALGGWNGLASIVVPGGAAGGAAAAAGAAGAVLMGVLTARRKTSSPSRRATLSLGAAGGAAVPWLGVGAVNGLVTEAGWSWFGASAIAAGASAALAGILAWVILGTAADRARRTLQKTEGGGPWEP